MLFDHLPLTSLQLRYIELDRRVISSRLRTQLHEAVTRSAMVYTAQQEADVMLAEDQERRGVNRPWAAKRAVAFIALALSACGHNPATPTAAQIQAARVDSPLVNVTAGNPDVPPNLAELVALGRNLENEQDAKRDDY